MRQVCSVFVVLVFCQVAEIIGQGPFVINAPNIVDDLESYDLSWNDVGDFLLRALRDELKKRDKESVPIPEIHRPFQRKEGFITLNGQFDADHGWFKNLSSIRRTGDVVFVQNHTIYTVTCELGFSDMELGYDHYQVTVSGVKINGHMTGSVGANSIQMKISAEIGAGHCSATLLELRVLQLDDMKLIVTGFGLFNGLVSNIANNEIDKKKPTIIEAIEKNLSDVIIKELVQVHC